MDVNALPTLEALKTFKPDLIVVDGGTPQLLKVKNTLRVLKSTNKLPEGEIALIGIAKHPDRLVVEREAKIVTLKFASNNPGFNLIILLRDEAHRFARKYHLFLRHKSLIGNAAIIK